MIYETKKTKRKAEHQKQALSYLLTVHVPTLLREYDASKYSMISKHFPAIGYLLFYFVLVFLLTNVIEGGAIYSTFEI